MAELKRMNEFGFGAHYIRRGKISYIFILDQDRFAETRDDQIWISSKHGYTGLPKLVMTNLNFIKTWLHRFAETRGDQIWISSKHGYTGLSKQWSNLISQIQEIFPRGIWWVPNPSSFGIIWCHNTLWIEKSWYTDITDFSQRSIVGPKSKFVRHCLMPQYLSIG